MTNLCWCVNDSGRCFCGVGIPYIWCVYAKGPGWLVAFRVFICMAWVWQSPPVGVGFVSSVVRRCATLPHPVGCSTIAVPGLSFRVRNGSGRLPWAMAAASLQLSTRVGWLCGCLGTGGWTRRVCVRDCRPSVWLVWLAQVRVLASARGTGLAGLCFDR